MKVKEKMDKKALKALKGSIKKWEGIVSGKGIDKGSENCPLCKLFYSGIDYCSLCPIYQKTGDEHCQNTPYIAWVDHLESEHNCVEDLSIQCPTCKRLAEKELKFLKSLLPKKTKKTKKTKNIH
jgi:hypothetical protein